MKTPIHKALLDTIEKIKTHLEELQKSDSGVFWNRYDCPFCKLADGNCLSCIVSVKGEGCFLYVPRKINGITFNDIDDNIPSVKEQISWWELALKEFQDLLLLYNYMRLHRKIENFIKSPENTSWDDMGTCDFCVVYRCEECPLVDLDCGWSYEVNERSFGTAICIPKEERNKWLTHANSILYHRIKRLRNKLQHFNLKALED